jgi:hypothetical protein
VPCAGRCTAQDAPSILRPAADSRGQHALPGGSRRGQGRVTTDPNPQHYGYLTRTAEPPPDQAPNTPPAPPGVGVRGLAPGLVARLEYGNNQPLPPRPQAKKRLLPSCGGSAGRELVGGPVPDAWGSGSLGPKREPTSNRTRTADRHTNSGAPGAQPKTRAHSNRTRRADQYHQSRSPGAQPKTRAHSNRTRTADQYHQSRSPEGSVPKREPTPNPDANSRPVPPITEPGGLGLRREPTPTGRGQPTSTTNRGGPGGSAPRASIGGGRRRRRRRRRAG